MNCFETIDLMGDALDGSLAPEHQAGFHEHLTECTPCRTYLDQLRVTLRALEGLPRRKVARERKAELVNAFRRELGKGNRQ